MRSDWKGKRAMGPRIAVIVSTYDRPEALALVLDSLADQTTHACEVIVADDGSDEQTRALYDRFRARMPAAGRASCCRASS